MSAEYQPNL